MKHLFIILNVLLSTAMIGCKKMECFDAAGPVETITRKVSSFYQIDLYDNIDLVLIQDTVETIQVACGKYIQPNIMTKAEKNILTIRNNTTCKWLRNTGEKIIVYAHVKMLNKINYESGGDVTCTNTINTDHIDISSETGAGNVTLNIMAQQTSAYIHNENADFILSGQSDYCNTFINARGTIDYSNFVVKNMNIEYAGVRDATINVTEQLKSIVYHTGNLYYKGSPAVIDNKQLGTGQLIKLP